MAQVDLYQYINEIKALLNGNQFAVVAVHCQHVLKSYPRHVETYKLLAKSYLVRRQYDEALDLYQRILSADPTDLNALLGMARIYNSQKKFDAAARYLAVAIEFDPYNEMLKSRLRELYQRQKQQSSGVGISRAALGILHFRSRLYRQAIQELTAVLKEQPERLDLLVLVAEAYWRLDHHVEADKVSQQILAKLPNCIKANAILAEIWLRTDKIAGAQKHVRLVQSLTLPAQNHLDADMPEGRAFLIRDSVNIPKQVAVEYLEAVDVTEDASLYDVEDDWETGLGVEDDFVSGFTPAVEEGEEVEVDFFSLLESADAEDVFAFDEALQENDDTSGGSSWLNDISQSGEGLSYADEGDFASSETTSGLGRRVNDSDVPDWLSEINEDEATSADSVEADEVPTWLNETGELRNPFETDNMPSWMEEIAQEEEEEHSDLFMTEDELAGLWQHEDDDPGGDGVEEVSDGYGDDFSFLDGGDEPDEDSSSLLDEPSLFSGFQPESEPDQDDSFSFLDFEDDDATGDGFSDWMTATGSNLESPVVGDDESVDDEDLWFASEDKGDAAAAAAPLGEPAESGFDEDDDWLNALGGNDVGADERVDVADEDLETFAFAALEDDEADAAADFGGPNEADEDLMDFAFMDEDDSSDDLMGDLSADFDSFGEGDDDGFGEDAPDWLSDVANVDQDASILSQQHTSRLLMPEGEDAPDWLLGGSESSSSAADEESSLTFELDDDPNAVADDVSWLNDLEGPESLGEQGLDFAADDNDSAEWLTEFDRGLGNEAGDDQFDGIAEDDEVELPDWVSGTSPLAPAAEDEDDDLADWLSESAATSPVSNDQISPSSSLEDESDWLFDSEHEQESDLVPDWLSGASAADVPSDEDDFASGADWLSEMPSETEATAGEESATPDWLGEFEEADDEVEDSADGGSDWLSEMPSETAAAAGEESATPDWLGVFEEVDDEVEDSADGGSDWLSEMPSETEAAAGEESATPDWLGVFEEVDDEVEDSA
ncbi:MAG: tetratricopeptide repeat protein, partial [Anaerolineales bacterium]|nr:tetratricopeptide repeat protein [Anaerolineales bacterium]